MKTAVSQLLQGFDRKHKMCVEEEILNEASWLRRRQEERGEGGQNNPKLSLPHVPRCRVDPFLSELDITSSLSDSNDTPLCA